MPTRKKDRREERNPVSEERRGADRRQSQRILVDLEVDYQCEDTFLFAYITDMSAFGIFIRTNNPEPAGTHLNLRFRLPEGSSQETLALEGEVIWINPFRPGDINNINPGMGVKFLDLDDNQRHALIELIRKFAYLESDDPEKEAGQDPASSDPETSDAN